VFWKRRVVVFWGVKTMPVIEPYVLR